MAIANQQQHESSTDTRPTSSGVVPAATAHRPASDGQAAPPVTPPGLLADTPLTTTPTPPVAASSRHRGRKWLLLAGVAVGLAAAAFFLVPRVATALNTVSTDDAYVSGHMTFVAPRVSGQVARVYVDDNYHVKKGDVLIELDKEPYEVQVAIRKAAFESAEADLAAANAHVRSLVAVARANRFGLQHAIESVNTQAANLRAALATLNSNKASLDLANANLKRGEQLGARNAITKEQLDELREAVKVDEAAVDQALQQAYAIRVGLGLPAQPPEGKELSDLPPDLDQTFSTVRQALATLIESAAQIGYFPKTWEATPNQALEEFYKQDPEGNLDHIYSRIIPNAPAVKQAEAKLLQARRDLDKAELDLRYCDVFSEIDGVVTRRSVNQGNNVSVGQSLMEVRSLTEIWVDANFKETQLADLRIGQRAKVEVDMYGRRREFDGRITGFTMGTGQTLSLLPPQNATGNFVKIVQRLPVRIELTDYDPASGPLFIGLSATPHVYFKERPIGPHAGEVLQPLATLPRAPLRPVADPPEAVTTDEDRQAEGR